MACPQDTERCQGGDPTPKRPMAESLPEPLKVLFFFLMMLLIIDIFQERKLAQRGHTFLGSHSWRSRAGLRTRSGGVQGLRVHWGS